MPRTRTAYFKKNQEEVVSWWNPESDVGAEIFKYGLDRAIKELRDRNVKEVMDAACGKGRATKELSKYFNVTAVDISAAMLAIVDGLKMPRVKTVEADLDDLPFRNGSFDAVILLAAAVHLDNNERVFGEFYRVLRPNGLLILDIDNQFGAMRLLKNILDPIFCFFDKSYKTERFKRRQIFQPLRPGRIKKFLNCAGFKIKRKDFVGILMPFRLKNRLVLSPGFFKRLRPLTFFLEKIPIIKNFSTYIYFTCQK